MPSSVCSFALSLFLSSSAVPPSLPHRHSSVHIYIHSGKPGGTVAVCAHRQSYRASSQPASQPANQPTNQPASRPASQPSQPARPATETRASSNVVASLVVASREVQEAGERVTSRSRAVVVDDDDDAGIARERPTVIASQNPHRPRDPRQRSCAPRSPLPSAPLRLPPSHPTHPPCSPLPFACLPACLHGPSHHRHNPVSAPLSLPGCHAS